MSDFDPSLLEGKDRKELVAIATSLGRKPPSRAKKADMIKLIMDLVGADTDEPTDDAADKGGGQAEKDPPKARKAPAKAVETPAGDEPDAGGGGETKAADKSESEDEGGRADSSPQKRPAAKKQAQPRAKREPEQKQQEPRAEKKQADQKQSVQKQPDQKQPDQKQSDQSDQQDDGEGNRRRRRRGRGRGQEPEVQAEPVEVEGVVDLRDEGFGFLRVDGYLPHPEDAYISIKQVRQFGLRRGDVLTGRSRAANRNERNPALIQIETLNGIAAGDPNALPTRAEFDSLTPIFPDEHLRLEQEEFPENLTARVIDLLAPIGKGQRGLIVSPPKAGKTTVVKDIVRAIERNDPDVHVIVLLIDERPEEVTDMRRWMINGEVAASTFDRPVEEHIAVSELVTERAKRMVEGGRDVAIVLDGITRLTRAHNLAAPGNGRTMAGGMDASALYPPKKLFGAARNIEEGGSLTILATALVETNTRLDEVVFEEFKGTGNMELRLDRQLAERRIYPAIDVDGSSTRHEELLYDRRRLDQIHRLRRLLSDLKAEHGSGVGGIEMLVDRLRTIRTNAEFLDEVAKSTSG